MSRSQKSCAVKDLLLGTSSNCREGTVLTPINRSTKEFDGKLNRKYLMPPFDPDWKPPHLRDCDNVRSIPYNSISHKTFFVFE